MGGKSSHLFAKSLSVRDVAMLLLVVDILLLLWSAFEIIYLRWSPNAIISNPAWDRPYIRPAAYDQPRIVGIHYFGDFLQTFDWATLRNPWTNNSWFLAQYPPLAIYLLKPLTVFPYFVAMAIYLFAILASSFLSIWCATKDRLETMPRIALSVGLGLVSAPILMAFDRGNSVGFLALLFSLFAHGLLRDKKWLAITAYVLMASTKIYPALLIVLFIRKRWHKEAVLAVGICAVLSFGLFAITPGNIGDTFSAFLKANTGASGNWSSTMVLGAEILLRLTHLIPPQKLETYALLIVSVWAIFKYLLVAVMLAYAAWSKRLKVLDALLLAGLAMVTYYPAPYSYAWTWALPMIGLLLVSQISNPQKPQLNIMEMWSQSKIQVFALLGLLVMILPMPLPVPGTQKSVLPFIGYAVVIVIVFTLLVDTHGAIKRGRFQA